MPRFIKGQCAWNKGLPAPWVKPLKFGFGKDNPFYGKRHTFEAKEKMRIAKLGKSGNRKGKNATEETKEKLRIAHVGHRLSQETRIKISLANKGKRKPEGFGLKGEKNSNWKGGKGTERHRLMGQIEYKLWRTAVFIRDNYTCQKCKIRGKYMEADHIKPWVLYPELRFAIDNGRTLCISCHRQTDTWGGRIFRQVERVEG